MSSPDRPQGKENFVSRVEFEKMVDKVRQCEADKLKVMKDQGNLMKEFNKRMQVHLEEIRLLKDVNQKLQADLQELRDLTCYLDDDRQKCRKLAREWQRFGRYTASVMRNEVANYQDKLKVLEEKQIDLSKDNAELKELCLYLDRQRESIALDNRTFCSNCSQRVTSTEDLSSSIQQNTIADHDQDHGNSHSQRLEAKLTDISSQVGTNKEHTTSSGKESSGSTHKADVAKKRVSFTFPGDFDSTDTESIRSNDTPPRIPQANGLKNGSQTGILRNGVKALPKQGELPFPSPKHMTPEAVAQAMRVLEIHERLEHPDHASISGEPADRLGDNEVEVLKEMCNVVWRKLSDEPEQSQNGSHDNEGNNEILEDLL